jgi:amino acid transporter
MEKQILPGLKLTFLIHSILAMIVGLIFAVVPQFWGMLFGQSIAEVGVYRVLGVAILAFGASSWWAYREHLWERVKILAEMEIVWTILGALITVYALMFDAMIFAGWVMALTLAVFAVAFAYFYVRESASTAQPLAR